jgi:hypothetical protein
MPTNLIGSDRYKSRRDVQERVLVCIEQAVLSYRARICFRGVVVVSGYDDASIVDQKIEPIKELGRSPVHLGFS